jgi:hypothetical protein
MSFQKGVKQETSGKHLHACRIGEDLVAVRRDQHRVRQQHRELLLLQIAKCKTVTVESARRGRADMMPQDAEDRMSGQTAMEREHSTDDAPFLRPCPPLHGTEQTKMSKGAMHSAVCQSSTRSVPGFAMTSWKPTTRLNTMPCFTVSPFCKSKRTRGQREE